MGASSDFQGSHYVMTEGGNPTDLLTDYPISMACWLKVNTFVSGDGIMGIFSSSNIDGLQRIIMLNSGSLRGESRDSLGNSGQAVTSALSTDTWYHICYVAAASNDRKMYVDGVEDGTDTTSITFDTMGQALVGAQKRGTLAVANHVDGKIVFPQIYDRALSVDEINEIMHNPNSIPNGLVWYIDLLKGGSVAADFIDLSGNGGTATAVSAPAASLDGPPVHFPINF